MTTHNGSTPPISTNVTLPDGFAFSDTIHLVYEGGFTPPLGENCNGVVIWPFDGGPMQIFPPALLPLPDDALAASDSYAQSAAIVLGNAAGIAAEMLTGLAAAATAYAGTEKVQKFLADGAAQAAAAAARTIAQAGAETLTAHRAREAAAKEAAAAQLSFLDC